MLAHKRPLEIEELNANHYMVSVHKYGFFLCRRGTARILLGSNTYKISVSMRHLRYVLCLKMLEAYFSNTPVEPMIRKSGLDWTIVRCTTVKECPTTGKVTATLDGKGLKFSISAADMAAFMVGQVANKRFLRQSPTISN